MNHTLRVLFRSCLLLTLCVCATTPLRAAETAVNAFEGAAYDNATANDPNYADTSVWPEAYEVQKTNYFKETWPKAPLYVWAVIRDDKDKGKGGKETDPKDPANWAVDGAPATRPPSQDDDVLFPPNSVIRDKEATGYTVRHLTVSKGASVSRVRALGNVWIKQGGGVNWMGSFNGGKNVFLRNDSKGYIGNKVVFNKPVGSSIEILGRVAAGDEVGFFCGTTILGPGASLVPGDRSTQGVWPDAKLVLLSGASFHKNHNQTHLTDLVINGELLAGTPERPLTRDCTLGLSFKDLDGDWGLVVNPKGKLMVHSSNPAKARLVIAWHGLAINPNKKIKAEPGQAHNVRLVLQGQVSLAGVFFDYIQTGGIPLADQAIRSQGEIAFGEHNQGKPDELFRILEKPMEYKLRYDAAQVPKPASDGTNMKEWNPGENK